MRTTRHRLALLGVVSGLLAATVGLVAAALLYDAALEREQHRLRSQVQSYAALVAAVARFDRESGRFASPEAAARATLAQVAEGRRLAEEDGEGESDEVLLAAREGDAIAWKAAIRGHARPAERAPVPWDEIGRAVPMRRALRGERGVVVGAADYRGAPVVAAFEPVPGTPWGVVAKVDLTDVRAPYVRAGLLAAGVSLVAALLGVLAFSRVGGALVGHVEAAQARAIAVFEGVLDAVVVADARGTIRALNPAAERLFGYPAAEALGRSVTLFMGPPERDEHDGYLADVRRGSGRAAIGRLREVSGRARDGRRIPLEIALTELRHGGERLFVGVLRDQTERRARDAVEAAERAVLARLVGGDGVGEALGELAGAVREVAPEARGAFLRRGAAPGGRLELLAAWGAPEGLAAAVAAQEGEGDAEDAIGRTAGACGLEVADVHRFPPGEGQEAAGWLVTFRAAHRLPAGLPRELARAAGAICERAAAAAALHRQEARYRHVVETAAVPIVVVDAELRVLECNPAAERLCGVPRAEVLGRPIPEGHLGGAGRERFAAAVARAVGGEAVRAAAAELTPADGEPRDVVWDVAPLGVGADGPAALAVGQDRTERARLEAQLRHAQKLEAVGRLAGGVAHDFNNMLSAILGYADLAAASDAVRDDARVLGYLAAIQGAAERSAVLTRQLLAFARKQVIAPRVVDPNALTRELRPLLARLLEEAIAVELDLAEGVGAVEVDPNLTEQAIINLALNACDAMAGSGRLTISTRAVDLAPAEAEGLGLAPGPAVAIAVSDTGCGMDESTVGRIFDPFFTTKGVGEGTGLGLASVHGFVRQSGGAIRVASAPGEGATFEILLPPAAGSAEAAGDEAAGPGAARREPGPTRVLVVEDDELVRELVTEVLADGGYDVRAAATAEEGLGLAGDGEGAVDVIVSDVVLPGRSGPELVGELLARRPDLRAILTSGYPRGARPGSLESHDRVRFLPKPVAPADLLEAVAAAAAGRPADGDGDAGARS